MATGNSIVSDCLVRIGRLESGGTATTTELADGVVELNRMLGMWSAQMGPIFAETLDSLTWTAGSASKTIGTSGDFNVARPQKILGAWYRDSGNSDHEIDVVPHRQYQQAATKTTQTTFPECLAYNQTFTSGLGTLFVWPIPAADLTIRLLSLKPLTDLTGAGTVSLPPGYEDAIISNLTPRLADIFGAEITPFMMERADESKKAIIEANLQFGLPDLDPYLPGQAANSNSRAGWNI